MAAFIYNDVIFEHEQDDGREEHKKVCHFSVKDFKKLVEEKIKKSKWPEQIVAELVMYTYGSDYLVMELVKKYDEHIKEHYDTILEFAFSRLERQKNSKKDNDFESAKLDLNMPVIYYLLEKNPEFYQTHANFILKRFLEHYTGVDHEDGFKPVKHFR